MSYGCYLRIWDKPTLEACTASQDNLTSLSLGSPALQRKGRSPFSYLRVKVHCTRAYVAKIKVLVKLRFNCFTLRIAKSTQITHAAAQNGKKKEKI